MIDEQTRQAMRKAAGLDDKTVQEMRAVAYQNATQEQPGMLETFGRELVKPALQYGSMVGESLAQAGRFATSPEMRRAAMPGVFGEASEEDLMKLGEMKPTFVMDESQLPDNPADIALMGAKRTAGMASYLPVGQGVKGMAMAGTAAGALSGFASSDPGEEMAATAAGGILGGVFGAGMGFAQMGISAAFNQAKHILGKPQIKHEAAVGVAEKIIKQAQEAKNVKYPGVLAKTYASLFPFSKKGNAFERLKPVETVATMIEDGIWGTGGGIRSKMNAASGINGIATNIIAEGLERAGNKIELPPHMLQLSDVEGVYTHIGIKQINQLNTRLMKAAPGGETVIGKSAKGLMDFQRTLEKEAYDVLAKPSTTGEMQEFAAVKLVMSDRIEKILDEAIKNAGGVSDLTNNPYIIAQAGELVSSGYAQKIANSGGDLRALRALQKDYVRMNQIIQLADQESASLGQNYLGSILKNIPGVRQVLSASEQAVVIPLGTGSSIALDRASGQIVRVGQGVNQAAQVALPQVPGRLPALGAIGATGMLNETPEDLGAYSQEGVPLYR